MSTVHPFASAIVGSHVAEPGLLLTSICACVPVPRGVPIFVNTSLSAAVPICVPEIVSRTRIPVICMRSSEEQPKNVFCIEEVTLAASSCGISVSDEQLWNVFVMAVTLDVSKSGISVSDEQLWKADAMVVTLDVSKSGISSSDEQPTKADDMLLTLDVSKSGNSTSDEQPKKAYDRVATLDVSKSGNSTSDEQPKKAYAMVVTLDVSKRGTVVRLSHP